MVGGSATPSLVVVDETVGIGTAVQVRQNIADVKIGPTMEDDDRRTPPNLSRIQVGASGRHAAPMRRVTPLAFKGSHATLRQSCRMTPRNAAENKASPPC